MSIYWEGIGPIVASFIALDESEHDHILADMRTTPQALLRLHRWAVVSVEAFCRGFVDLVGEEEIPSKSSVSVIVERITRASVGLFHRTLYEF